MTQGNFLNPMIQGSFTDTNLQEDTTKVVRPVECLGMTFQSDDARRAYFLDKLRERLQDPEFRKIEGFPIGADEDILALSDPPYYTACPNPFIEDFILHYGRPYDPSEPYHREPFAVDVSEGKTDPIYTAHSYHTKVPHKAIMPAILHYTEPGDVILDGFAGSGMTGVAAQMCANPDQDFRIKLEAEWKAVDHPLPRWGARRVVLNDLGPAATFISANYNLPFNVSKFAHRAKEMLADLKEEIGWMYETLHTDGTTRGRINYTVWSQIFACSNCGHEITFLKEALDPVTKAVKETFPCPNCSAQLTKDNMQKVMETLLDPATGSARQRIRLVPVIINYSIGKAKYEKAPDAADLETLRAIEVMQLPSSIPTNPFPIQRMYHGSRLAPKGVTHVHHLYFPRAAQALGRLWARAKVVEDVRLRNLLYFWLDSHLVNLSIENRYRPEVSFPYNPLGGVYYVPSLISEASPFIAYENKMKRIVSAFVRHKPLAQRSIVHTGDCSQLKGLASSSIDYIFTDPPFGENIYYADLNFLVESWHRVWTNAEPEAIIDKAKHKALLDYQRLMQSCFEEYCRVLKPGRWMTVVFHNSRVAVWNAIQEAMLAAGFMVANVGALDKQQHSYRQVTSSAMKEDLVISVYKPNGGLEGRFKLAAGSADGVWDFVRTHLRQVPVFVQARGGQAEVIAERLDHWLFSRMVAFHVQRGVAVPMTASEFYAGLSQRFLEFDGMYFLPEQFDVYKLRRTTVPQQPELYVSDESSAILWLRLQLANRPQTLQELTPQFLQRIMAWQRHEVRLELREILEENFLSYNGQGSIPAQIVSWMKKSSELRELIAKEGIEREDGNLETENQLLRAKASDRWYVPDPNRAIDLEKWRLRELLKEFALYQESRGKLTQFRTEAVRAGFRQAYNRRDFDPIMQLAQRIPDNVIQEDADLLMYYDVASLHV